jgi:hypothetical protein
VYGAVYNGSSGYNDDNFLKHGEDNAVSDEVALILKREFLEYDSMTPSRDQNINLIPFILTVGCAFMLIMLLVGAIQFGYM